MLSFLTKVSNEINVLFLKRIIPFLNHNLNAGSIWTWMKTGFVIRGAKLRACACSKAGEADQGYVQDW